MSSSASKRLFFALWPPDHLRQRIDAATGLAVRESGGRAIPSANFHVTLVFLGSVPLPRIQAVEQAAAAASVPPFDLVLDRIEVLPRSSVLCLTAAVVPPLKTLVEQLRSSLAHGHFELEGRKYRPHLTLARDLPRRRPRESIGSFEWHVDEFVLVASEVSRSGSQYSVLSRWPLRG